MSNDTIYREDAINVVGKIETMRLKGQIDLTYAPTIKRLKAIPSADRPQGEWIKNNLGIVICSECKRPRRDNRVNHINFCNSCGARMKGADDE